MNYLMTGSTGLLGRYLVRDLLAAGVHLTLPVRRQSTSLTSLMNFLGQTDLLKQVFICEGDVIQPSLGLKSETLAWLSKNCQGVIHLAASLKFCGEYPAEPWRTNWFGTKRAVDLCEELGLPEFHYVSTAYIRGGNNDYEESKWAAEQLVRLLSKFRKRVTIYRPGIIVGDSTTGYTSTFHGFYAAFKLLSCVIDQATGFASTPAELEERTRAGSQRFLKILGLTSQTDGKNYVPVDWVSKVMARIITQPSLHEQTYHLVPDDPVPMERSVRAMEDTIIAHGQLSPVSQEFDWERLEQHFAEGAKPYLNYGPDHRFVTFTTRQAVPDLPCPEMDVAFFRRLCEYAILTNFGKRPLPTQEAKGCGI